MAIKHDLYVQLDPKDLKNGLASFFHAKNVDDGGAWNSRTRSLNSNKSDNIVIDFGEDSPYTEIVWKEQGSNQKQTSIIEKGKVILPTNINYNDIQLYSESISKLYRYENGIYNKIIDFDYDEGSYFNSSSTSTYVSTTDFYNNFRAYPRMRYPNFQVNSPIQGHNPISAYADRYLSPIIYSNVINDANKDKASGFYFMTNSKDISKVASNQTYKYKYWGFLTNVEIKDKIIYNPLNQRKRRLLIYFDESSGTLHVDVFKIQANSNSLSFSELQSWLNDDNTMDLNSKFSPRWEKVAGESFTKKLSKPYITLVYCLPGEYVNIGRVGNGKIDYNSFGSEVTSSTNPSIWKSLGHPTLDPRFYESKLCLSQNNSTTVLDCGDTYAVTFNLLKYKTIKWSPVELQTVNTRVFGGYAYYSIRNTNGYDSTYGLLSAKMPTTVNYTSLSYSEKYIDYWTDDNFTTLYTTYPSSDNDDIVVQTVFDRKSADGTYIVGPNFHLSYPATEQVESMSLPSLNSSEVSEIKNVVDRINKTYWKWTVEMHFPILYKIFNNGIDYFRLCSASGNIPVECRSCIPAHTTIYWIQPWIAFTKKGARRTNSDTDWPGVGDFNCYPADQVKLPWGSGFYENAANHAMLYSNYQTYAPVIYQYGTSVPQYSSKYSTMAKFWDDTVFWSSENTWHMKRLVIVTSSMPFPLGDIDQNSRNNSYGLPTYGGWSSGTPPFGTPASWGTVSYSQLLNFASIMVNSDNYILNPMAWSASQNIIFAPRIIRNKTNTLCGDIVWNGVPNSRNEDVEEKSILPRQIEIYHTSRVAPGTCGIIGPVA